VPLHFTAFHPDWKMTDIGPTPPATLTRARSIALRAGLNYVYTGNVHDESGGSTYCPSCGEALIVRDWYDIRGYQRHRSRRLRAAARAFPGGSRSSASRSARAGFQSGWRLNARAENARSGAALPRCASCSAGAVLCRTQVHC
jgi:pyruvate formate lyase activating enzyme